MRKTAIATILSILLSSCATQGPIELGRPLIAPLNEPATVALSGSADRLAWPSAHRAAENKYSDNSIQGIAALTRIGVPLIEVDVRMNRSEVLFLFHDGKLNGKNFSGPQSFEKRTPESLTAGELASIYLPDHSATIPLLSGAFEAIRGTNSALELDIKHEKESVLRTVLAKAQALGVEKSILVQAEHAETIKIINAEFPSVKTSYRCKSKSDLGHAITLQPTVIELEGWHDEDAVARLHRNKIRALVNVAESDSDNENGWKKLFDIGVDIIMTNHAEDMLIWLRSGRY